MNRRMIADHAEAMALKLAQAIDVTAGRTEAFGVFRGILLDALAAYEAAADRMHRRLHGPPHERAHVRPHPATEPRPLADRNGRGGRP